MKEKIEILKKLDNKKFKKVVKLEGELISLKKYFISYQNMILKKYDLNTIKDFLNKDWRDWNISKYQFKILNNINNLLKLKYYEYYLEKAELIYSRKLNYQYVINNKINDDYFKREPTYNMSLYYYGCKLEDETIFYYKLEEKK